VDKEFVREITDQSRRDERIESILAIEETVL
jgi:hypothetical protein